MPATTLNINVDVPKGKINIEKLQQQVTLYAQFIVNNITLRNKERSNNLKHFSELKGILKHNSGKTDKQLLDEYLTEKYGV